MAALQSELAALMARVRASGARDGALASMVLRLGAPVAPEALLRTGLRLQRAFWDPAGGARAGDAGSVCGLGETVRLESAGPDRVALLRERAERLFARVETFAGAGGEDAPAARCLGGMAFRCGAPGEAWEGFAEASFVLPRWSLSRHGEQSFLRLTVRTDALDEAALADELRAVEAALGAADETVRDDDVVEPRALSLRDETGAERWAEMIRDALSRIGRGELQKVVAARRSRVSAGAPIEVADVLARMRATSPGCARFAVERGGGVFLGASPEWLVAKRGAQGEADALAGSRARRGGRDELDARELLASEKDLREHALVVDAVRAAFASLGAALPPAPAPRVRTLRQLHHLWTPVHAALPAGLHALDLVAALHPTPAVCGLPATAASTWIARSEPVERGWYAAPVGWFDARGDGAFVVAIRSALVRSERAWLYAGAGIVRGSEPAAEFAEAGVKQLPMLQALGMLP